MKIVNRQISIKSIDVVTSEYIEAELKKLGFDAVRWAIVSVNDNNYILNVSCVE